MPWLFAWRPRESYQSGASKRLQGVNVKTRKRNVAVPHDPAGFAEGVLTLLDKHCSDVEGITNKLTAAIKALDGSKLDFARYGVELFEIFFAGARMGIGTKLADDTKLDWNVRSRSPRRNPAVAVSRCL